MNIKLISPRMSLRPTDSYFKRVMSPPLSLITLATLTPKEHKVTIADENTGRVDFSDSPDLVGITVNVDTSKRAFDIAAGYRKRNIPVVFGGIYASANFEQMLEYGDAVVIGEAENVWGMLLEDVASGNLDPVYKTVGVTDMKKVPLPDWSYIKQSKYLYSNIVVASRGCPYKCHFCYNSSEYVTNPFRNRNIDEVIKEIRAHRTKQIMFIDDNFIGNVAWTKQFIASIKDMGLTWHAAVSADIFHHKDLIDDFAASGCRSLFIGFESIVSESIQSAGKKQNKVGEYEQLIQLLHSRGIMVNASLVFGFDDDTKNVFHDTLQWLIRNKVETMTAHILTPYPGTRLYKDLIAQDRILTHDVTKYNTSHVVFEPRQMSPDELYQGYLDMYKNFYSWKNILKRWPDNKKIRVPYILFNLGYRKFGKITSFIGRFGLMNAMGSIARRISYGIQ